MKAVKYQPGMENGFWVYYSNVATKKKEAMMHEGISIFFICVAFRVV